jgi:hypothetical protein
MDKTKTTTNQLDLSSANGTRELTTTTSPNPLPINKASSINIKLLALVLFIAALGLYFFSMFIFGSIALIIAVLVFFTFSLTAKSKALTANNYQSNQSENSIKKILFEIQYLENIGNHGENLFQQHELLFEKYNAYLKLLASKFNPNEITFQRYHSAVEVIYMALLENFKKMANSYKVLSQTPIKELKKSVEKESDEALKMDIQNKISMYNDQLNKTLELYNLNQKALTEMDKLSFALNEIKNSQTPTEDDLKDMMKQLQELADRAQKYNV